MCCLTIQNPKPEPEEEEEEDSGGSAPPPAEEGSGAGPVSPDSVSTPGQKDSSEEEDDPNMTQNDYSGGGLTAFEKSKLITLGCDDIIKGNDNFGPSYSNNVPNFELIIAKCPAGCYKSGTVGVIGLSIHNEESSVCKSAIVDNASPFSGGVIGVGIVQGIEKYDKAPYIHGLEVKSGSKSKRSFFTFKVDNVDFCDRDIRIIDNEGMPSHRGRIELRLNGKWGTICAKGTTEKIGREVCRMLKYQDGIMKNPPDASDFCSSFDGQDYCGAEP